MKYVIATLLLLALVAAGATTFAAAAAITMPARMLFSALTLALLGLVWVLAGMLEAEERG
jgi:FtsH-binding integral membrane protein